MTLDESRRQLRRWLHPACASGRVALWRCHIKLEDAFRPVMNQHFMAPYALWHGSAVLRMKAKYSEQADVVERAAGVVVEAMRKRGKPT